MEQLYFLIKTMDRLIEELKPLQSGLYGKDFLLTWERTEAELKAILKIAEGLKSLYESNCSTKVFQSGLAVSLFRDHSTRTRFSYASAANLLGLTVQDLEKELVSIIRKEIGAVACFRKSALVKRLPKTRSGKILRKTIRQLATTTEVPIPPTIDDPAILDEIRDAMQTSGIGK